MINRNCNISAYAFAADVRDHAQERATRFRRSEQPERIKRLVKHSTVHDARTEPAHSTHLRRWRQSTVLGMY